MEGFFDIKILFNFLESGNAGNCYFTTKSLRLAVVVEAHLHTSAETLPYYLFKLVQLQCLYLRNIMFLLQQKV